MQLKAHPVRARLRDLSALAVAVNVSKVE